MELPGSLTPGTIISESHSMMSELHSLLGLDRLLCALHFGITLFPRIQSPAARDFGITLYPRDRSSSATKRNYTFYAVACFWRVRHALALRGTQQQGGQINSIRPDTRPERTQLSRGGTRSPFGDPNRQTAWAVIQLPASYTQSQPLRLTPAD